MSIFDDLEEVEVKYLTLKELLVQFFDHKLAFNVTKDLSKQLTAKGYTLTADDLNKLRQLFKPVFDMTSSKAKTHKVIIKLAGILGQVGEDISTLNDAQANRVNTLLGGDTNYRISKTSLSKFMQLLRKKKIIIETESRDETH
jgi:hypothetical protein